MRFYKGKRFYYAGYNQCFTLYKKLGKDRWIIVYDDGITDEWGEYIMKTQKYFKEVDTFKDYVDEML